MGCGCRKSKGTNKSRVKVLEKKRLSERIREAAAIGGSKMEKKKIIEKKLKFCKNCSHSRQTREEIRKKTKVCHKANVSIQGIINNQDFKCPIGNF